MKITLLGYGKMGKTIEQLALEKGHQILHRITGSNASGLKVEHLQAADVVIEFSRPEIAFENIARCLKAGVPVVSGTTGWLDKMEEAQQICSDTNGAFFYASNFSIGVNIFFAVNRHLASMMQSHKDYSVWIEEVHHTQKRDYPSGTAITLAEGIIRELERKTGWEAKRMENDTDPSLSDSEKTDTLLIASHRKDKVPGTHVIQWSSPIDTIEISHTAHSREGFAAGALAAAEWIIGKKGCFQMKDMLGF